uniref:HOOK N-terminal domain-containing protein n=1 Tax=Sinocyclocheilus rhinocerous TaxID=307959 RepID=A0A673J8F0_9TELE
ILTKTLVVYHSVCVCQVLGQQVSDEHVPDVCLIAEMGVLTELGRLLQLVLGCAVSCDHKQGTEEEIISPESHDQLAVIDGVDGDTVLKSQHRLRHL